MKACKFLIVDDDLFIQSFIERSLTQAGASQFFFGNSGREALELATRECPDLIILDVRMNGGNGLSALRQIKEGPSTAQIPVLMITGEVDFHFVCDGQHASAVLPKPFTQRQLVEEVTRLLGARKSLPLAESCAVAA